MQRKNNNLAPAAQRRGAFWLALLSVAWMQVSFAAHQFDHSGDLLFDDSCHACSHLDRVDDLVAHPTSSEEATPGTDRRVAAMQAVVGHGAVIRRYDSRGPPQL